VNRGSARSILITGCSSGIGLACARTLRARGWRVLATARKEADLARLEQSEGLETLRLELSDPRSVSAAAEEALLRTDGKLYALFNNAGMAQVGAVEDLSPDHLRHQLEVNVVGAHELIRRVLPAMRANGTGRIVQCSSVLGLVAAPYRGAYSASKYAMEALSDALRLELRGTGVAVSLIEPGPIRTRLIENALANFRATVNLEGSPHRDLYRARLAAMEAGGRKAFKLEPEAVAAKLVHALESRRPKARYFVTMPTYFSAFAKRILPTALLDRIAALT
jgi:NAD(P)-dependent dehydrogenase (short-subunit alcohol dehydrogenase family)